MTDMSATGSRRRRRLLVTSFVAALSMLTASGSAQARTGNGPPTWPQVPETPLCGIAYDAEKEFPGETRQQSWERLDGWYDGLESVRSFFPPGRPHPWPGTPNYPGAPVTWPGTPELADHTSVITVSFKIAPSEILAGQHDDFFRKWFANAPTDKTIYWVYWHEPEPKIKRGAFSAGEYKKAWRHLDSLADESNHPRLYSTLTLMTWTLDPRSGRDWRDYYAGRAFIDVVAWDGYNNIVPPTTEYLPPEEIFGRVVELVKAENLPWAVAEVGSAVADGDDGTHRALWLKDVVEYLTAEEALFVQYFDLDFTAHGHSDYRLRDEAARQVWSEFCDS